MDIIRFSILKPVTILAGIIMLLLFGIISLTRLPYQLSPTVIEPEIQVKTSWRGATPYEIEREIIEEQENILKGLPDLIEMESEASNGQGSVTLRFKVGTSVEQALLRVTNKINEVASYPADVDNPVVNASGATASPVIWMILKTKDGNQRPVQTYKTFFENEVRQHIERVNGVSELFVGSGTEDQMHVIISAEKLAAYGLTINYVIEVIQNENTNISAGTLAVGRHDFRVRTIGEFKSAEDIAAVVLRSTGQQRVLLGDVAEIRQDYAKKNSVVLHNGIPGIAIGVRPETGTNILDMTNLVEARYQWLNANTLEAEGLYLDWVYDQRFYINGAIDQIQQNILFGGLLAVGVLLLFLRSVRATIVVATAIPISVIGTFIFLDLLGRNLNVVSLAGIAFAVGMLVDNAIVVIENIVRHRQMGKTAFDAVLQGTKEVWGAVLASTVTTVAVFLPVVFIEEEAGQLFRDIAIAVVAAVSLSLFVSVSVIPMFAYWLFNGQKQQTDNKPTFLDRLGQRLSNGLIALVTLVIRNWLTRISTIGLLISLAMISVWLLTPKMEYLPQGNRNLVLNILIPPPGLSTAERVEIGERFFDMALPHIGAEVDGVPAIKNMFYVGAEGFMISGAISEKWDRARELLPFFTELIYSIPGMYGVSLQPGVFESGLGEGRAIKLNISGNDLNKIVTAAGALFNMIHTELAGSQIRPIPSIELTYPEVQILPNHDRLRANNMSNRDLGIALDVLMDGRVIGDFKQEGKKKIDLILKAADSDFPTPQDLYQANLATPAGKVVPVSSLAQLQQTTGVALIRHLETNRTVTLQITPPNSMPLQRAMEIIEQQIIPLVSDMNLLNGLQIDMSGAADKLVRTREALQWNFLLAALIAYLLMASLFGNFIYPLIIMLTVPLAGAGGFIGLKLLNIFIVPQPMDVLTMLGFVILVGVVVNNAILIVYQALNNFHSGGMDHQQAVLESTRSRLRPIYMSATTSICGMLPLVLIPGPGSELYRGLGSVILGGLAVSTVFTIFVIPAILVVAIRMEKR
ncbi:efflux RND transporter permease subunit [Moritella sp.]|uniref:efflux RND transporter permease subunit n=1 Tax=Moritella sp. TaxID=78556 RepID=UPI001D24B972|nr:efflux RND transporter permease subunit [Moritella sp.]MCJ8351252.1 efflux RND transporter permease subunit [Moritella sp.]NQZ41342.1 efflux RND transporter permease subunit [Moritella sp.]